MSHAQRILVAGASGAGKSTLAADISAKLGIPYTEIDSLFDGPNWEPREDFVLDVAEIAEGESWVSEWQYADARAMLARQQDLKVIRLKDYITQPKLNGYRGLHLIVEVPVFMSDREVPAYMLAELGDAAANQLDTKMLSD